MCGYERAAGFLSTLSLRRATKIRLHPYGPGIISIHALLAESDRSLSCVYLSCRISIHALLAESDPTQPSRPCWTTHFYPRSPCGERRWAFVWTTGKTRFLSTLSLRRATYNLLTSVVSSADFYPRSPCGERLLASILCTSVKYISIHALLAESDAYGRINDISRLIFLSTLSLRRATVHYDNYNLHCCISIHALLAESD